MKKLFAVGLMLIAVCTVRAEDPATGLDKNSKAITVRLGHKIMHTGMIQAGPAHEANQALMGIPKDDSGKFRIAFLVSRHEAFKEGSEKLLKALDTAEQLIAFVNVDDVSKSWFMPQIRWYEDGFQKAWYAGMEPVLFPKGPDGKVIPPKDPDGKVCAVFPAIAIFTPEDGRYGEPGSLVTLISGFDGDIPKTVERMQKSTDEWIQTHSGGQLHGAAAPLVEAGKQQDWPMPAVFAQGPPMPPVTPFDSSAVSQWPTKRFNNKDEPKPLTRKQIKELIPEASKDFLNDLVDEEPTSETEVRSAWATHQAAQLKAEGERLKAERDKLLAERDSLKTDHDTLQAAHQKLRDEQEAAKKNPWYPPLPNPDDIAQAETVIPEAKPETANPQQPASSVAPVTTDKQPDSSAAVDLTEAARALGLAGVIMAIGWKAKDIINAVGNLFRKQGPPSST